MLNKNIQKRRDKLTGVWGGGSEEFCVGDDDQTTDVVNNRRVMRNTGEFKGGPESDAGER